MSSNDSQYEEDAETGLAKVGVIIAGSASLENARNVIAVPVDNIVYKSSHPHKSSIGSLDKHEGPRLKTKSRRKPHESSTCRSM